MVERVLAFIVDESKWPSLSMALGLIAVLILLIHHQHSPTPVRLRIMKTMNLFYGVTIGTLAFGHLLAVTTKLFMGTLTGSAPFFYAIGAAIAVPSWWLVQHAVSAVNDENRRTLVLNAWLVGTLAAMGIHNLVLASPGVLNIGYHMHSRQAVGWTIVAAWVVFNLTLFVGSIIFFASGQSFEQFRGME